MATRASSGLGSNVSLRPRVQANGETVEKFLAAVSQVDQWMRKNPKQAAQVATRWISGLKAEIAEAATQYTISLFSRPIAAFLPRRHRMQNRLQS